MAHLLIVGLGYSAGVVRERLVAAGWSVEATTRDGRGGTIAFDGVASPVLLAALDRASHVLSSVPPAGENDPVLDVLGGRLGGRWLGYLSSTGVYGDAAGAWVDEGAPTGGGRRSARARADADWLALGARVLRLPGIYGPGRSPLDRVRAGTAHRVDVAGQVFSRVHVDDLASGVVAALRGPAGAYNLAAARPCSQNEVVAFAARLLGLPVPPMVPLSALSPMARGFYGENRRVANGKARRVLGWAPVYRDYRLGLRALNAITSPAAVTTEPATASADQR
jgi:hypothetical protein